MINTRLGERPYGKMSEELELLSLKTSQERLSQFPHTY